MTIKDFPIPEFVGTDALDRDRALCVGAPDPDIWFPFPKDDQTRERAQAICARCPIAAACARFGIDNRLTGIWGGIDIEFGRPRTLSG